MNADEIPRVIMINFSLSLYLEEGGGEAGGEGIV